jgi:hypothetical protein
MADAQCILTLRMTKNITKVINEKEKMMLETAAHFISICYAPWALKSYMVAKAPSNVLSVIKSAFITQGSGRLCLPEHAAPFLEFT